MTTDTEIDLPADGACPCGCKELMLARDQTEYTPYTFEDGAWRDAGSHTEEMDSDDPMGSVRMFCTDCGQYFNVPEELQ